MKKQKCILVANGNISSKVLAQNINPNGFLVGVDKGAVYLLKNHYPVHLSIGDFDSVNQKEFKLIKQKAKEMITFNSDKDYTDTELALREVIKRGYKDIVILGAIGSRLDHSLVNILLLEKYAKSDRQIKIVDDNNEIEIVRTNKILVKNSNLPYVSLISLTNSSLVSLVGFKYPLKNKKIKRGQTLCISNELIKKKGTVEVKSGKVLIIRSKD